MSKMETAVFLISSFLAQLLPLCQGGESEIVTLADGSKLGGHQRFRTVPGGGPILSYEGIPFARPPLGELRFSLPQEPGPWDGVISADKKYKCAQVDFLDFNFLGEEDCLYLNVYVPGDKIPPEPLPVMFWIHGGGWFSGDGTSDLYGPGRLLDSGEVILVSTNYRLAAMGFLSMDDEQLPANLGMWDQNFALKWVQKNIAPFGGNPNKVTIFGESAGAVSVLLHVLSPHSSSLFQAAIAQSGTPISAFARLDRKPAYYARSLALEVGCDPNGTSTEIRDCLLKKDVEEITRIWNIEYLADTAPLARAPLSFVPTVDGDFIPKEPMKMIEEGNFNQVPVIIGYNKDEGLLLTCQLMSDQNELDDFKKDLEKNLLGIIFGRSREEISSEKEIALAKRLIQEGNLENLTTERNQIMMNLEDLIADSWFLAAGAKFARDMARASSEPVYEYMYHHQGSSSLVDFMINPQWKLGIKTIGRFLGLDLFRSSLGVCHFDEVMMLFDGTAVPFDVVYTEEDWEASRNLVQMWTSFAATVGDPTPGNGVQWERIDPSSPKRLNISSHLSFGPMPIEESKRLEMWQDVYREFPPGLYEHSSSSFESSGERYFRPTAAPNTKQEL